MIHIITDTNASLPQDLVDRYSIRQIPIYVHFGNKTFRDGIDITSAQFYEMLEAAPELPRTSQPPVGEFIELFNEIKKEDPEGTILAILLSSNLSGTYSAAVYAQKQVGDENIHVFDSKQIAHGYGLMVLEAAKMAEEGASIDVILAVLEDMRERVEIYTTMKSLKYLEKGGRIGKAAFLLGSVLDLKPVLGVKDGFAVAHSKYRTYNKAVRSLLDIAIEEAKKAKRVIMGVMHANVLDIAQEAIEELKEKVNPELLILGNVGAGVGTHVGPGAFCVAWYTFPE